MKTNDQLMRQMAKIALEQATQHLADFADKFAADPRIMRVNGRDALLAFSAAIRSTNTEVWPGAGDPL